MSTQSNFVREDDLPIDHTGRVTLPDGIGEEGNVIQAVLIAPDGERKHFAPTIISKHRITVPAKWRREYGIESGDTVDIEVSIP